MENSFLHHTRHTANSGTTCGYRVRQPSIRRWNKFPPWQKDLIAKTQFIIFSKRFLIVMLKQWLTDNPVRSFGLSPSHNQTFPIASLRYTNTKPSLPSKSVIIPCIWVSWKLSVKWPSFKCSRMNPSSGSQKHPCPLLQSAEFQHK